MKHLAKAGARCYTAAMDKMPETLTEPTRFPCAQCGADLRFEPGAQALTCDYCGHVHPMERARSAPDPLAMPGRSSLQGQAMQGQAMQGDAGPLVAELDFRRALAQEIDRSEVETTASLHCTNCGADFSMAEGHHASECPFCATPIVTDTGAHRHFKPKGILPFALTEREARGALARWLEGLWFAPNGVRSYARAGRALQGVYLPYWTFDAQTRSDYAGQRGDTYYVTEWQTVLVDGKHKRVQRRVPKTRWTPVAGHVERLFDDVLVRGSRTLPGRMADKLEAWDLHALQPYTPSYLAGFAAESYSVDLEEGFAAARAVMDLTIRRDVRFDIGGDQQRIARIDTETSHETFKHILLPVYLAAYQYGGKSYRFVVNGRTGEVIGERPYSSWKIALAAALGLALVTLIAVLAAQG
ncbi:MAG: primosomal protein N' (replication factor Y) - superfamily II helicase [Neomegalonema sp.]|nr:primosomal protein N' (replication factor Y) - superfamily II helicase [Neomegalonema sp.]